MYFITVVLYFCVLTLCSVVVFLVLVISMAELGFTVFWFPEKGVFVMLMLM
jgi:hypothetical protein